VGLIHVLMLSRAIEAQVTIEELCDTLRQISPDEETDKQRSRYVTERCEAAESSERRAIPRVDFW